MHFKLSINIYVWGQVERKDNPYFTQLKLVPNPCVTCKNITA
jgi:hypothetical protein